MFKLEDGREHFYQWDSDRRLIIEDATVTEVHFCNRTDECALVVEVYEEAGTRLANVPNILLQDDWNIKVYAYDGRATLHSKCFDVNKRSRPSDYAYTETEVLTWHKLDEKITKKLAEVEAAEATREANELFRNMAESERQYQETNRALWESNRQEAETARQHEYNTLSNALLDKIEEANTIVVETGEALETAQLINSRGEMAIYQAGVAADSANREAGRANTATINAEKATANANTAADVANMNASRAGQAASAAEYQAYLASEAADRANAVIGNGDVANAVTGIATGDIVAFDVSPIEHDIEVKVRSKNLIPFPYPNFSYNANNGITVTVQDDGGVVLNGTATAAVFVNLIRNVKYSDVDINHKSTHGMITNAINENISVRYDVANTSTYIYILKNTVCDNVVFYPQLEYGTKSTEYTPYIDVSNVSVIATGKNVIDKGIEDTNNWEWANVATAASNSGIYTFNNLGCGTYTISGETNTVGDTSVYMYLYYSTDNGATWQPKLGANGVQYIIAGKNCYTITFEKLEGELYCIWSNQKTNINKAKLQIEAGETATKIEPYSQPVEYTVNADGAVDGLKSIYPTTTLFTNATGAIIEANYNKDINKVIGGNHVEQVQYNSTDGSLQGRVYIVDKYNKQTSRELRITSPIDSIPVRNANGNFYVGTPRLDLECTNKKYVDEAINALIAKIKAGEI